MYSQVKLYPFVFLVSYMSRCVKLSLTQRTQSLEVALHINVKRNKQNAINYLTYLTK